ncbi:Transducin/WD40 repeat-like superfamily protein [Perilla frutescens var. frutescens]|nr:Transducin/WD40 repeat-like superfamily protein [Perilla frutescens var. frutescens]
MSFPIEAIRPIACNNKGTYIAGGGISGDIYFWEVATGKLLKWHAYYRAVTCLAFNDDQSLLISGAEDGCLRVWSMFLIFDTARREEARNLFEYSFHEHSLIVWSLSRGKFLRNIVFPSIIDVISIDPREHVLYAGGRDGKIYIDVLNAPVAHNNNYGPHIIGSLSEHG